MTKFVYCVYCEDNPEATCFETEAEAMELARTCPNCCVEKNEVDEDGNTINTEVIYEAAAASIHVDSDILVDDNPFKIDFPRSDIEDITDVDDKCYKELADFYAKDPTDYDDLSRDLSKNEELEIKEAVKDLEEHEDEVECKCCFDLFPKVDCIKTEDGYICKKCDQELHSHQGTNLDLIDNDPFSLDYNDPRGHKKESKLEIKEKPVDGNELRKHEKAIEEESLKEHINEEHPAIESGQVLQGTDNAIVDCKTDHKVIAHSEDEKPLDCKMEKPALEKPLAGEKVDIKINEDLSEDEIKELDKEVETLKEELKVITDFSDYRPWSGAVDTYNLIRDADKLDDLEAYLEDMYPDGITATQINDILWFDGEEVLKYLGLSDVEDEEVDESLKEAKEDDELPVDPEAAKLEVHTRLNDLVSDEIEAINGYEEAKKEILDTPITHKDAILDTIDHIEDEEKEHVDELIAATTEIPFDKEEAPAVEGPVVEENLNEVAPDTPSDSDAKKDAKKEVKKGDKIRIIHLNDEDNSYDGKEGIVDHIDSLGQLHGTWGGLAVIPGVDKFEIIAEECLKEEKAKPEADKEKTYNDGLKLAKAYNKPVIYGYTNKSYGGKFFALDDPIVCNNVSDETKKFKAQYKSAGTVYVAYPDKDFVESCKLSEGLGNKADEPEVFTPEEQEEYNCDEDGNCLDSHDTLHHCGWCGEVYAESEMRHEVDFGWICDRCENELKSHGGPLTFIEEEIKK